jgi:hypothetical protein
MPLPIIVTGKGVQCKARAKSTKERCKSPAAYGSAVCRLHGARRPETIKRGESHPNYRHGEETLVAKAERSARLAELRDLEALSFKLGLAKGHRWRGTKPRVP